MRKDAFPYPPKEGPVTDREYIEVADGIARKLEEVVEAQFDRAKDEEHQLSYHNRRHTQDVRRRVRIILAPLIELQVVSLRVAAVGDMGAAGHDSRQRYEMQMVGEEGSEDRKYGKVFRKRMARYNEDDSAADVVALMRAANMGGKTIFLESDMDLARDCVEVTVADKFNGKTVVQPNLLPDTSPIVRAIALADLGAAGMDGPEKYEKEGDALFREEQMDMHGLSVATLDDPTREYYRKRMLGWLSFQPKFAQGRKERFEEELGNLSEPAKEALRKIFCHFDETIEASLARFERIKESSFEDLYKEMGFVSREDGGKAMIGGQKST